MTASHSLKSFGLTAVDWEQRVDFDRLRRERLARLRAKLEASDLGALLTFDFHNIRYMTATHIGTWAMDKLIRFALLPRGGEPVIWDFGSAARHHLLYNPWLDHGSGAHAGATGVGAKGAAVAPEHGSRPGISTLRGAFPPAAGQAEEVAKSIKRELDKYGLAAEPVGVDVAELPVLAALGAAGIRVVDGQQVFLEARRVKTEDEISLLVTAASMVDAAYDQLYAFLRPGVRENECVGLVAKSLYDSGSEHVEGVNAISGERCSPHPHVYSDRILRPGDPAFFDILHSFNGYRTCYYRTFAVGSANRAQRDAYRLAATTWTMRSNSSDRERPPRTYAPSGRRRRSSAFRTNSLPSPFNTGTGSGSRSGRSPSSADCTPSSTPRCSKRAWYSPSRPTGRPRTAGRRLASRRKWWSPRTAAKSSPSSLPRSSWWRGNATSPLTGRSRRPRDAQSQRNTAERRQKTDRV